MLLVQVDPRLRVPASRQIQDQVMALVDAGVLRPGHRLPPTRELARRAGVHRSTVVRAYEELRALGYVESRSGAYTTVRARVRGPGVRGRAEARAPERAPGLVWERVATQGVRAVRALLDEPVHAGAAAGAIDFERLAADPVLVPRGELQRCMRAALAVPEVFNYADPAGYPPLRRVIADRLRAHGVAVSPEEVLVTAGAQHALDLVLRLLARAGDRVVVEAPTYGMMHALLRAHGLRPLEVPMRADGMDLDVLARSLRRGRPRLVYTMPTFHNPTGVTTSAAHRERLLRLCEAHRVPLIEDGFEEELKYFGKVALPIKALDARGLVLYVSAFSKHLFPGARIGWIAAPRPVTAQLAALLRASSLAVSTPSQVALTQFARGRGLESHLRRVHRAFRQRMLRLQRALETHLPSEVAWTRPTGGYTVWLELPGSPGDEARLMTRLATAGLAVAPGNRFFARPRSSPRLRVSIACVEGAAIDEGCRRLGTVLSEFLRSRRNRP